MECAANVVKEQHRHDEGNLHCANNFDSWIHADLPQAALTCKFFHRAETLAAYGTPPPRVKARNPATSPYNFFRSPSKTKYPIPAETIAIKKFVPEKISRIAKAIVFPAPFVPVNSPISRFE